MSRTCEALGMNDGPTFLGTLARRLITVVALTIAPARIGAQAQPPAEPPGLHWTSAAFDSDRGRILLFGGMGRDGVYLSETWQWDGTRWTMLVDSISSPGPRSGHSMAFDESSSRVVLFGGSFDTRDTPLGPVKSTTRLCDTWALAGSAWTRIDRGACAIDGVWAATLVARGARGDLLLMEGWRPSASDGAPQRMRLWRWADTTWAPLDSSGPRRSRESNLSAAFDDARSVLVVPVLGGPDTGVWEWDGKGWRHHRVAMPPTRMAYATAYDSRRKRVALIGGVVPGSGNAGDPSHRWQHDHWTWDGSAWTEVPTAMLLPTGRAWATLLDDRRGERLLYVGGVNQNGVLQTLWFFDRDGWRHWEPAAGR